MGFISRIFDEVISLLIGGVIGFCIANRGRIWITLKTITKFNKEIRISVAYLYKIKIDGSYLLTKGSKIDQYQPIGGVYKYYNTFGAKMNELGIRPETAERFYENNVLNGT